jgi:hypothetical protein
MKYLIILLFIVAGCSLKPKVKEEVKTLGMLKTECDNLQVELEALQAKKFTKVIDDKIKQCKDHGFWQKPQRKPPREFLDIE